MPLTPAGVTSPRATIVRLLSLAAALSLGLLWVVVLPPAAYACSCNGLSTENATAQADAIFAGRIVAKSTVRKPKPGRTELRFEVSRVYKGTVYQQQVVASPRGSDGCGIDPELNSSWVILAEERVEGSGDRAVFRLVTELCSGNRPGTSTPVAWGRGSAPLAGPSDREENAVNTDATLSSVLKVGGVVLGALVLLAGVGLAVVWRPGRVDP